jgi:hypothetical protein
MRVDSYLGGGISLFVALKPVSKSFMLQYQSPNVVL